MLSGSIANSNIFVTSYWESAEKINDQWILATTTFMWSLKAVVVVCAMEG